jgi:hypothetical protein
MRLAMLCWLLFLASSRLCAQDVSRDTRIPPEQLGLPKGTKRTSEPFVTRIYKTDALGAILKKQPQGYPFTINKDYTLKEDEDFRTHQGVDFSSRPAPGERPTPLDFKAGVHGVVVKAGDGEWGTITVQIYDGTLIQYLHTLASHVKVGDVVGPDTLLGVTGRTGTGTIHLHIQAKDQNGNSISPDLAFRLGQSTLQSKLKPDESLLDFDPEIYSPVKAKVVGRKVAATIQPESKWIVEVIGEGGRADLVLGEFFDYQSASRCAVAWSESRPDDLRLTREREVTLKPEKPE